MEVRQIGQFLPTIFISMYYSIQYKWNIWWILQSSCSTFCSAENSSKHIGQLISLQSGQFSNVIYYSALGALLSVLGFASLSTRSSFLVFGSFDLAAFPLSPAFFSSSFYSSFLLWASLNFIAFSCIIYLRRSDSLIC